MFYSLSYFKKNENICPEDFNNRIKDDLININLISSIQEITELRKVFSGDLVGYYSVVTMSNKDCYYIYQKDLENLIKKIKILQ